MKKAGVPQVSGAAAHHIAPGGHPRARAVLDEHNIDVNQADNGVYLAVPGKPAPDPTLNHGETFNHAAYGDKVADRLEAASASGGGRNAVLDELGAIRNDLLEGRKFW